MEFDLKIGPQGRQSSTTLKILGMSKWFLATKASSRRRRTSILRRCSIKAKPTTQFIVKVADTLEEAIKLMEVGFEYHAEIEGHKLFRKRK